MFLVLILLFFSFIIGYRNLNISRYSLRFFLQIVGLYIHHNSFPSIVTRIPLMQVYDVTPFLDDHPGGDEVLVTATEKDATTDFEDIGHSDSATEMMEKYFVGEVDTNTLPAQVTSSSSVRPPTQAPVYNNQSSGFVVKILQYIVPLLILAFAFGLQYYGKKSKSEN